MVSVFLEIEGQKASGLPVGFYQGRRKLWGVVWVWKEVHVGLPSYTFQMIARANYKHSDRLQGQWGISEVRDCILAAQHLSTSLNLIDPSRMFIRGGSSGGYTVLAAISNPPPDTPSNFKWAGATSLYGISDLQRLGEDTHKFESKYLNGLIGGSYEEVPEVYKERSPISHVDKIDTPLLVSSTLPPFPPDHRRNCD